MIELVLDAFIALDRLLAPTLAAAPRVAGYGLVAGAVSMALYALTANQKAIAALKREARDSRRAMAAADGDLADFGPLMRHNLAVTFKLAGRVMGPSLVAAAPVLAAAFCLDQVDGFGAQTFEGLAFLPAWLRGWPLAYFAGVAFAAVAVKIGFRIE
ncbi:MAG: hypothetical protein ACPGVX_01880 [Thalassobaculaceae bacterium]